MSDNELLSQLFNALEALDGNFEFWITVTFATIITAHFAGNVISGRLRLLILVLYTLSTVLFNLRMFAMGTMVVSFRDQLDLTEAANHVYGSTLNIAIGILMHVTIIVGAIGTILYLSKSGRGSPSQDHNP